MCKSNLFELDLAELYLYLIPKYVFGPNLALVCSCVCVYTCVYFHVLSCTYLLNLWIFLTEQVLTFSFDHCAIQSANCLLDN